MLKINNKTDCFDFLAEALIVIYTSKWERLSEAADRIMASADISREQAEVALCRALADGVIKVRAKLQRHAFRTQTSSEVLTANDFQIPDKLEPSDFDWDDSRPIKPWSISERSPRHGGPWYLEKIKVSSKDVTEVFLQPRPHGSVDNLAPAIRLKQKKRATPSLNTARNAVKACYPDGVPTQDAVPNATLCRQVSQYLKKNGQSPVSNDTILRAAGRRK